MKVFVVYSFPQASTFLELELEEGATVAVALGRCGYSEELNDLPLPDMPVGVFGRVVSKETVLNDGDRVEIYRPLLADPKEARRRRGRKPRR